MNLGGTYVLGKHTHALYYRRPFVQHKLCTLNFFNVHLRCKNCTLIFWTHNLRCKLCTLNVLGLPLRCKKSSRELTLHLKCAWLRARVCA